MNISTLLSKHIVIMGVSGCGKTTLAKNLSKIFGNDLIEADDLHPEKNIEKMHSGIPLSDEDRLPWLESIRDSMTQAADQHKYTIVACSALKVEYRKILSSAKGEVFYLHLDGDSKILEDRLKRRVNHFMPPSLLPSQLKTLQKLTKTENGAIIDFALSPASQIKSALAKLGLLDQSIKYPKFDIGVIGAGVMGSAFCENLASQGYQVGLYDIDPEKSKNASTKHFKTGRITPIKKIKDLTEKLTQPRILLTLVPAGKATQNAIEESIPLLTRQDILVDLGNSLYTDTVNREKELSTHGIHFSGCGMSGGEEGARKGPALMFGGSKHAFSLVSPLFSSLAAQANDGTPCLSYCGTDGAGHYVKMVHNGIEYALMQLLGESYTLLEQIALLNPENISQLFSTWIQGPLQSYLLEISAEILNHKDSKTALPFISIVDDAAGQKGTGAWTTQVALNLGCPVNMIAEATLFRGLSSCKSQRKLAQAELDQQAITVNLDHDITQDLEKALLTANLLAFTQGIMQIQMQSEKSEWAVSLKDIVRGWRAGCIIRSSILEPIAHAYETNPNLPLLIATPGLKEIVQAGIPALRRITVLALSKGIPLPTFVAALEFYDSIRNAHLPTALIQAQRDFFGAHTYQRNDSKGRFHTYWNNTERVEKEIAPTEIKPTQLK